MRRPRGYLSPRRCSSSGNGRRSHGSCWRTITLTPAPALLALALAHNPRALTHTLTLCSSDPNPYQARTGGRLRGIARPPAAGY
eukprot:scaffold57209_cov42-Phaeocystis_antarctica.AAC.1